MITYIKMMIYPWIYPVNMMISDIFARFFGSTVGPQHLQVATREPAAPAAPAAASA